MQLQNKEVKIKYSIILERDEMDAIISALDAKKGYLGLDKVQQDALDSLRAFRGAENEPTEQGLPRTIMTPVNL